MVDRNAVKGAVKELMGKGKDALGKATGDRRLQTEGKAETLEGKLQKTLDKVASALKR